MSREIKFRAWDTRDKEMHYRAEHTYDCGTYYGVDIVASCFGEILDDKRYIVEQYTGLTDKNGKEIYEKDIVQDSKGMKCRVEWNKGEAHFGLYFGKQTELTDFIWLRGEDLEVIGNIHENPDLLK